MGEFRFTSFRRHRSRSYVASSVVRLGSSVVRLIDWCIEWSKPDDPRLDSSNHESSSREGHPENSSTRPDGWVDIAHLSLGSTTDGGVRADPPVVVVSTIEPMQPISLRCQTLVRGSGVRRTRAFARRDDDGSVGFARLDGLDRAARVARVYGALWILVWI